MLFCLPPLKIFHKPGKLINGAKTQVYIPPNPIKYFISFEKLFRKTTKYRTLVRYPLQEREYHIQILFNLGNMMPEGGNISKMKYFICGALLPQILKTGSHLPRLRLCQDYVLELPSFLQSPSQQPDLACREDWSMTVSDPSSSYSHHLPYLQNYLKTKLASPRNYCVQLQILYIFYLKKIQELYHYH